jgi:uncharacterized membrane protein
LTLAGNEGLVGLVAGLGAGLLEYAVATRVMKRRLGEADEEAAEGGPEMARQLWRVMNVVIAVTSFGVFPLVGYLMGRALG